MLSKHVADGSFLFWRNIALDVFSSHRLLVSRHVAFTLVNEMWINSIDILRIDVRLAELALKQLIQDEAKHLIMANVRFHEVWRVCSFFLNALSGAELNRHRTDIWYKYRERFVTAYVRNPCDHEVNLVGEKFGVRVDQDQTVLFSDNSDPSLGIRL